jgi:hypothetical protein
MKTRSCCLQGPFHDLGFHLISIYGPLLTLLFLPVPHTVHEIAEEDTGIVNTTNVQPLVHEKVAYA